MKRKRFRLWLRTVAVLVLIIGCNIGCGPGGVSLPDLGGGQKMMLSVEATGVRTIPKTQLFAVPDPLSGNGVLAQILFDAYAADFVERATELDDCKVATASEPADPDKVTGAITVSATVICRLGPKKIHVREVVSMTLEPLPAQV